jgi:hypothetical protein
MTGAEAEADEARSVAPAGGPDGIVDAEAVALMVADQNDRDDPWDGPVPHRIRRYRLYRRADLAIADVDLADHGYDRGLAREYAATPADRFPPVVHDPLARTLVDGFHRTHAAVLRGEATIPALVGVVGTADPAWTPLD